MKSYLIIYYDGSIKRVDAYNISGALGQCGNQDYVKEIKHIDL